MSFIDLLRKNAVEVNQLIDSYLLEYTKEVGNINPKFSFLLKNFSEAAKGGKRIRAALVRLGYELAEGEKRYSEEVLKIASGYEIFQTAILAHDDIIDKSELRRGEPSLYMRLGGDHYGISQAIILSDIGFFLTIKVINETNFPEEIKNKAIKSFTDTFLKTGLGEALDVEISFKQENVNIEDVNTVNLFKTADYSVVGPLKLGIILAGGSQKLISDIEKFGEDLGVAFQLQDDILGVFGSEKETGKSTSSDIEEGKITLLYLKAYEKADKDQRAFLDENYGKGRRPEKVITHRVSRSDAMKSQAIIGEIKDIFISTKAVEFCKIESINLIKRSKKVIEDMEVSKSHKELLFAMADFLIERTK